MANKINAFVGHSFSPEDAEVIRKFTVFLETIKESPIDFDWEHAKQAEAKEIYEKVFKKMKDKNLFIGICTRKELVINKENLEKPFFEFFNKDYLKSKKNNYKAKTSDWLLQEIGYALGREMKIILLVEEGIRNPGALQGDLERINFSRDFPDGAFEPLMQMISSFALEGELESPEQIQSEIQSEEKEPKDTLDEYFETPMDDWSEARYEHALMHFVAMDNKEKEDIVFESYLSKYNDDNKRIKWEAERLYYKDFFQKENNMEKLKSIEISHPEIPEIKIYLANLYKEYEDLSKSAEYFEKASELFQDEYKCLDSYSKSAKIYAMDGKIDQSLSLIEKAKSFIKGDEDQEIRFLKNLQEIAKITKQNYNYLAYGERILNLKPDDHQIRFNLAYKYSHLNQDDMALFHYKILTEKNPDEGNWNNMGVTCSKLSLNGKAVDAYVNSKEKGGTLAVHNLAELYMRKGFYREAKELCEEGIKIEDHDNRIEETQLKIENKINEENKKKNEVIEKTNTRRIFSIKFGLACTDDTPTQLPGMWDGGTCPLKITIEKNSFIAEGEYEEEIPKNRMAGIFSLGSAIGADKILTKRKVTYSGEILGRGVRFVKTIEGESVSLLTGNYDVEGLMVISEGFNEIQVYEENKEDSENFYFLKKSDSPE